MDKQYLYDANLVKWVLEQLTDGTYWLHVVGVDEENSGFVGETLDAVMGEFVEGGYLYEEEVTETLTRDYYALAIVDGNMRLVRLGKYTCIGEAIEYADEKYKQVIWVLSDLCVMTLINDYSGRFDK